MTTILRHAAFQFTQSVRAIRFMQTLNTGQLLLDFETDKPVFWQLLRIGSLDRYHTLLEHAPGLVDMRFDISPSWDSRLYSLWGGGSTLVPLSDDLAPQIELLLFHQADRTIARTLNEVIGSSVLESWNG